jgi:RNA 3'-terminal phosphate cyclase (ATP)
MLHIDGSYGEGGGQIVRTAVSLSVLTDTSIKVSRIRSNRPNPGLRPQHHLALSIMKTLSHAKTTGLYVGSSEITFEPGERKAGSFEFDIGTAGSMTLVFQTILLGMLYTDERVHVRLHGGSDVRWSPSWDYFTQVFLPVIREMGVVVSAELVKRGYYPKGGGTAEITIEPFSGRLSPIEFTFFHPTQLFGQVHLCNLPDHIAKRMKQSVMKQAVNEGVNCTIHTDRVESLSDGVGITLWTKDLGGKLGVAALGEKKISAETVGGKAIESILADIKSNATVDLHLSDQILPFMPHADGSSVYKVRKITGHCKTNAWVLKQFYPDLNCSFIEDVDGMRVLCSKE